MFARVFALLPLALLASASHLKARGGNNCNAENQSCCNSYTTNQNEIENAVSGILDLGAALPLNLGIDCVPVVGDSCSQQTSCCSNVSSNGGLININCSPINA